MIESGNLVGKWIAHGDREQIWKVTGYVGSDIDDFTVWSPDGHTEIWSYHSLRQWSFFSTDQEALQYAGYRKT
jgi:hypothetical protein